MQMEVNLGSKGATYQSWFRDAVRVAFRELQEQHPKAGERKLAQLLGDRARDDPEIFDAAMEYIAHNMLNAQEGYVRREQERVQLARPKRSAEERQQENEELSRQAKEAAAKILYLNMEMPNGKRLRYCTGDYVAKVCAPLAKLGKKAGNKLMGQAYNEEDIRKEIKG
jgi:hypothetical protein